MKEDNQKVELYDIVLCTKHRVRDNKCEFGEQCAEVSADPMYDRCPKCDCRRGAAIHSPGYSCDYFRNLDGNVITHHP